MAEGVPEIQAWEENKNIEKAVVSRYPRLQFK
jgi:hypothetical protein